MSIRARLAATLALVAAVVASPLATGCAATRAPVEISGRVAPVTGLELRSGGTLGADRQRGKVVVLAFFSTWCGACSEAIPALDAAARELEDDDVLVVAVNEDEPAEAVDRFVRKHGIELPVALDRDGRLARHFEIPTLPSTVVIDRTGAVRYLHAGFHGLEEVRVLQREIVALRSEPGVAEHAGAPALAKAAAPVAPASVEPATAALPPASSGEVAVDIGSPEAPAAAGLAAEPER